MTGPPDVDGPRWFREAIARRPVHREIVVDGARIHRLEWDDHTGDVAVLLVHGGAAHAVWWAHVAPLLTCGHVAALDLSGHGDSDWREQYTFAGWAEEVAATARAMSRGRRVVLVGHSMGGIVSAMATGHGGVAGLVMVDAPLRQSSTRPSVQASEAAFRRVRASRDRDQLVGRFRPLPEQPVEHPALLRHVAEHSIRAAGDGWSWKFDPRAFGGHDRGRPDDVLGLLRSTAVPVGAIVADHSPIVSAEDRAAFRDLAHEDRGRYVELVQGHHHVMFDHPRQLAAAVDEMVLAFSDASDDRDQRTG